MAEAQEKFAVYLTEQQIEAAQQILLGHWYKGRDPHHTRAIRGAVRAMLVARPLSHDDIRRAKYGAS